jgi:hypothetical protein
MIQADGYNLLTLLNTTQHPIPIGSKAIMLMDDAYPDKLEELKRRIGPSSAKDYYAVKWCAEEHEEFNGYYHKNRFSLVAITNQRKRNVRLH